MRKITHLKDLVPDPQNRRKHNPRNIGMLVDALQKVGASRSIVVDEDGVILAGNGVVEAASEAGLTKVEIIEADGETIVAVRRRGLTDAQKRDLAIYDNRTAELAEWDIEQLQADLKVGLDLTPFFFEDELKELIGEAGRFKGGLTDPDAVPEMRATEIQPGDLFELGAHRLLCGDSLKREDLGRLIGDAGVNCIFADPPYGMGLDPRYDAMHSSKYHHPTGNRFKPVIGDSQPFDPSLIIDRFEASTEQFWLGADYYRDHLPIGGSWIVWDKRANDSGMDLDAVHGSSFELCWSRQVHRREIARILWSGHHGMQGADSGTRLHPTQKPIALFEWFAQRYSMQSIMDPFSGSGTALIGAERANCRCLAVEVDPSYCQIIIDRWEAFTGQKAVKVGEAIRV